MQRIRLIVLVALAISVFAGVVFAADLPSKQKEKLKEKLGKALFFDKNLSEPRGQSCAACHWPSVGFTGPDSMINLGSSVYPGAVATRFGNRKPPSAAYGGDSPILYFDSTAGLWIGGMFWDGRATGWTLGDPLAEQALGPFLNPLEQNLPSAAEVVKRVKASHYATLFELVWGRGSLDAPNAYELIGRSIAAYERSAEVSPFTSKYDYYLKGRARLTAKEQHGLELFEGKAMCSACHISRPDASGKPPMFTDFTYDNLGVPRNPQNPFYFEPEYNPVGVDWVDIGLGGFLASAGYAEAIWRPELGKHKVPTLRNVDKRPYSGFVKAYGHNGFFKSLEAIVHFYNTRDVGNLWSPPEIPDNVNTDELGDLGLTTQEEADLVAFMKTLTDGYMPTCR